MDLKLTFTFFISKKKIYKKQIKNKNKNKKKKKTKQKKKRVIFRYLKFFSEKINFCLFFTKSQHFQVGHALLRYRDVILWTMFMILVSMKEETLPNTMVPINHYSKKLAHKVIWKLR